MQSFKMHPTVQEPLNSAIDPDTLTAYRLAEYRVYAWQEPRSGSPPLDDNPPSSGFQTGTADDVPPWTDTALFTLRIGEPSMALAALHATHRANSSAFMTACNPRGRRLAPPENARRQNTLAADLEESGYAVLPGFGADPTGQWPGEPSFLVLDVGLSAARTLGHQFEQNALVWSGIDAIPQLVLLR